MEQIYVKLTNVKEPLFPRSYSANHIHIHLGRPQPAFQIERVQDDLQFPGKARRKVLGNDVG